jgi:menaquinone-dependent protoporphyrinogen IX oxidase
MKIVVVYESMFGNTKTIAEGIAEGFGEAGEMKIGTVDDLSPGAVVSLPDSAARSAQHHKHGPVGYCALL